MTYIRHVVAMLFLPSTSLPPPNASCYSVGTEQVTVYRNSANANQIPAFLTNFVCAVTRLKSRGQATANAGLVQPAGYRRRAGCHINRIQTLMALR